jgi:hypothetical protein
LDKSVTHTINGKVVSEQDARLAAESLRQGTDMPTVENVNEGKKFSKLGGFAQRPSRSPNKSIAATPPKDATPTSLSKGTPGK